jgi:hypothetical protein
MGAQAAEIETDDLIELIDAIEPQDDEGTQFDQRLPQ